jgi:hypothetical protein
VLATTKRKGSHDDKTTGRDDTNTNHEGADDDGDQGTKTNDEVEDGDDKGPSNQDNRNRTTRTTQHPLPPLRATARRVEGCANMERPPNDGGDENQARLQDDHTRDGDSGRQRGG